MDKLKHAKLLKRILRRKKTVSPIVDSLHAWYYRKFDRTGTEIDYEVWAKLVNEPEYYMIAADQFDNVTVVTTWLGIDTIQNLTSNNGTMPDMPLIFESVVKDGFNVVRHRHCYPTEIVALKNHNKLVFMADQNMFSEM